MHWLLPNGSLFANHDEVDNNNSSITINSTSSSFSAHPSSSTPTAVKASASVSSSKNADAAAVATRNPSKHPTYSTASPPDPTNNQMAYKSPPSEEQVQTGKRVVPSQKQPHHDYSSSSGNSSDSSSSEDETKQIGRLQLKERAAFNSRDNIGEKGVSTKEGGGRRMVPVTPANRHTSDKDSYENDSQDSSDEESDIADGEIIIDNRKKKRSMMGLGSSRKRSKISSDPNVVYKRLQVTLRKYEDAKKRIADLERKVTVLRNAKKKNGGVKDPRTKQYLSELRALIRYSLGHHKKFLPPGSTKWSDNPKTICQLVIKAIQWTPDIHDYDKIAVWNSVLAPNLNPLFSEFKNKIHQPMRQAFNSKFFSSSPSYFVYKLYDN
jgi:hypothetical protein